MNTAFLKEISSTETKTLKAFINVLKITKAHIDSKPKNIKDYLEYRGKIEKYLSYPFSKKLKTLVTDTDKKVKDYNDHNTNKPANSKAFNSQYKKFRNAFLNKGDLDELHKMATSISKITDSINEANKDQSELITKTNPFEISPLSSFFSGGKKAGLLHSFTPDDMDRILRTDLTKFKYSYLKLPDHDDYQYMVYFIENLKDSQKPIEVSSSQQKYIADFKYATKETYKALDKLVDKYLFSNDKKIIQEIMTRMQEFPELVKINDAHKRKIKTVFRGIPVQEENSFNTSKYIEQDKRTRFVATSESHHAAENFAKAKGHLDSVANSSGGVIIVYNVNSDSILLDTSIFGSAFGEAEILIDATKAKVQEAEYYDWEQDY